EASLDNIIKCIAKNTLGDINTKIDKFEERCRTTELEMVKQKGVLDKLNDEICNNLNSKLLSLSSSINESKFEIAERNDELKCLISQILSEINPRF
ncbi:unnamed protein product, partial [Brachionus calyciflorus]